MGVETRKFYAECVRLPYWDSQRGVALSEIKTSDPCGEFLSLERWQSG